MIFRPNSLRMSGIALVLSMMACGQPLDDARFPTGSQTLTSSSDYSRVYVANVDAGTVSVMSADGTLMSKHDVGISPTRIARSGEFVIVTLRGERAVSMLRESPEGLESVGYLEVGAEPFGVVAPEGGSVAYVALSQSDEVVEIGLEPLEVTRRFSVPDQPAYLALHPSAKALYVGSLMNGTLSHIDLRGEGEVKELSLPNRSRFESRENDTSFFERIGVDGPVTMKNRITGDLSVSPDGKSIAVPVLVLDNTTPVDNPVGNGGEGGGGYANPNGGIGRFNPAVVVIPSGPSGKPGLEDSTTVFAAGSDFGFEDVRSYINSISFSPDNMTILASMEGSDSVLVIPQNVDKDMRHETGGFETRSTEVIHTGAGPRGLTFVSGDQAFVHNFLDNTVSNANYSQAFERLVARLGDGGHSHVDFRETEGPDGDLHRAVLAEPGVQVEDEVLGENVAEGRRMFFSAMDERIAVKGGGVSCATCHFEGRLDGVTWRFSDGKVRQTPSLAGDLSFQELFTWTDEVPSIAAEARLTSADRMGGSGLSVTESRQIEAFVNSTFYPDTMMVGRLDERAKAGKSLFEREDVGCATCHTGEQFTDQLPYDMFGLSNVRTPTLLGISATGPYLHDGSIQTLEQLLQLSDMKLMGDTSMLSEAEKSDLVYYLNTL